MSNDEKPRKTLTLKRKPLDPVAPATPAAATPAATATPTSSGTLTLKRKPADPAAPATPAVASPAATATPTSSGTLTLKRKPLDPAATPPTPTATPTNAETSPAKPMLRPGGKRIIKREELANVQKPGTIKTAPRKPPAKNNKARKPRKPPRPKKTPPSDLRAGNLDASLNGFLAWLNYQPLAIGVEKQIFQHIAALQLSASKRVVQKLLRKHTQNPRYKQNLANNEPRVNLDGTPFVPPEAPV